MTLLPSTVFAEKLVLCLLSWKIGSGKQLNNKLLFGLLLQLDTHNWPVLGDYFFSHTHYTVLSAHFFHGDHLIGETHMERWSTCKHRQRGAHSCPCARSTHHGAGDPHPQKKSNLLTLSLLRSVWGRGGAGTSTDRGIIHVRGPHYGFPFSVSSLLLLKLFAPKQHILDKKRVYWEKKNTAQRMSAKILLKDERSSKLPEKFSLKWEKGPKLRISKIIWRQHWPG